MTTDLLYRLARPALFALDAERAHHLTLKNLTRAEHLGLLRLAMPHSTPNWVEVMGLRFPNRIGLAAGLDKDGAHIDALAALGFGFLEVGTVTPRAQAGNPKPRLFRIPAANALINRMGFNNGGLDQFLANVAAARYRGVLGLNIGKNADTPIERALDDYLIGLRAVYPHASYVTINISSPNTKDLRSLQDDVALDSLLSALKLEQLRLADAQGRYVPIAVKIAPDLDDLRLNQIATVLVKNRIDAVIATNTTIDKSAVSELRHGMETGGLSGAPVRAASTRVIRDLAQRLEGAIPIIGVGGILNGKDAREKIDAGASLVQLYTGLIYRGPALVSECIKAVAGS